MVLDVGPGTILRRAGVRRDRVGILNVACVLARTFFLQGLETRGREAFVDVLPAGNSFVRATTFATVSASDESQNSFSICQKNPQVRQSFTR